MPAAISAVAAARAWAVGASITTSTVSVVFDARLEPAQIAHRGRVLRQQIREVREQRQPVRDQVDRAAEHRQVAATTARARRRNHAT